jgi:NitT/TauT family transport system ATP-binding protein
MPSQFSFTSVSHRYAVGDATPATDDVTFQVRPGEFVALIGPSGCGKTTLLNMVAGLVRPSDGAVAIDGSPVQQVPAELGYMMARDALLPWRTALGNVEFALEASRSSRRARRSRAKEALAHVGLSGFEDHYPGQLSQGMRQRVAIARTLVGEPGLILMDEPFAALDAQTRVLVQERFLRLWEETKATVLLVTHDLSEAILLADRVAIMSSRPGRIKEDIDIELPRPRDIEKLLTTSEYQRLYQHLWEALRTEVLAAT